MIKSILFTVLFVILGEYLTLSYFNVICNLIGSILIVCGGIIIIVLNKRKEIKYQILFLVSFLLSVVSPIIIKYFPYCGGYENIQYSVFTILISVFYTIPYAYMMLKKSPISKKNFVLIMSVVSVLLLGIPYHINIELFSLISN